ncbi:adenylate/guanylate cyclase domain-containing protein [Pantanalinema rosaneae CENA516]|uniref:adenylate/guanylate cyclase domain-containing protein n=1 Tax=Pantanalinema rosaneae TaxID=1620701 RepID=UPI003D6F9888
MNMSIEHSTGLADILIVDDKLENIRFLSEFLAEQGYQVRKAINGQSALIAAKSLRPNLILLDVNMPGMSGYEVCERLKADAATCTVPIIFLSAGNDVNAKLQAFRAGGMDYITKPFQLEEVLVRIQTQLNIQTLQHQLQAQNQALQQTIQNLRITQVELELAKAESHALFKAMNELILVLDAEGRHLKIANTTTDLLYQPQQERLGKTLHEALPQEPADLILEAIQKSLATQQTIDVEYRLEMPQGRVDSWASISPIAANTVLCVVRDISDRKRREEALRLIVEGTAAKTGSDFFQACVQHLAKILGVRYTFVTECANPQKNRVRTLAFWLHQDFAENLEYDLQGTPCQEVIMDGKYACYCDHLIERFPEDQDLATLQARSYAGIPLVSSTGDIIGHIAVLDVQPMQEHDETRKLVLKIFAARAGAELERQITDVALKESQERSERLLLNILPFPIAERLKHDTSAIAEQFDEVTILFADIVGFTPLSAQIKPTELVNLLNQIFSAFDELTEKHRLEKIKTIGDAYMVVGGLPVARPDHAVAVAQMALDMQAVITQFQTRYSDQLQIRIGMNSGSVVAGVIGVKKFIYDLWGDAVNIASRMESLGCPGKIQVTAATYELLKDRYHLVQRGQVAVKGKGEMTTYWLVNHP